jgi:hypothetical protein
MHPWISRGKHIEKDARNPEDVQRQRHSRIPSDLHCISSISDGHIKVSYAPAPYSKQLAFVDRLLANRIELFSGANTTSQTPLAYHRERHPAA